MNTVAEDVKMVATINDRIQHAHKNSVQALTIPKVRVPLSFEVFILK